MRHASFCIGPRRLVTLVRVVASSRVDLQEFWILLMDGGKKQRIAVVDQMGKRCVVAWKLAKDSGGAREQTRKHSRI